MRWLVFLLLIAPLVSAQAVFSDYSISMELGDVVHEIIVMNINNPEHVIQEVSFRTHAEPEGLSVESDFPLEFEVLREGVGYVITVEFESPPEADSIPLKFEFDVPDWNPKKPERQEFSYKFTAQQGIESFSLVVRLPIGTGLVKTQGGTSVSPVPEDSYTDGTYIYFKWADANLEYGDEIGIMLLYSTATASSVLGYGIILLVLMVVFLVVIVGYWKRTEKKIKSVISNSLRDDEEKILRMIEESGEIKQKDVVTQTGFSKSKVSKMVRNLEERQLIEKIPHYKTNILKRKRE